MADYVEFLEAAKCLGIPEDDRLAWIQERVREKQERADRAAEREEKAAEREEKRLAAERVEKARGETK